MEKRNIEGFRNAHPGKEFPWCRSLTDVEMREIREVLKDRVGLGRNVDRLDLCKALAAKSKVCQGTDADSESFGLLDCLSRLAIEPREKLLLNFYRYDDIDELLLEDVNEHFEYMWYPGSDDIDIFDNTLSWIVSVSHDGDVSVVKF
jgi:hypothetical protein